MKQVHTVLNEGGIDLSGIRNKAIFRKKIVRLKENREKQL